MPLGCVDTLHLVYHCRCAPPLCRCVRTHRTGSVHAIARCGFRGAQSAACVVVAIQYIVSHGRCILMYVHVFKIM